ncbi:MAG: YdcF family protein [Acidobacteriota bacterium]|nr:YdcF family protein [Acidobacteriota bacterium]
MRKMFLTSLFVIGITLVVLLATSGGFLVLDKPQPADIIVVLAGETERRPLRGMELLNQNLAPRLLLDVPAEAEVYGRRETELAREYEDRFPNKFSISICPVFGLSTKAEVNDVKNCLQGSAVKRVLLVTSDFHTRRALNIFAREAPAYNFSVAATFDARYFSSRWWMRREWAKTNLDEWLRLVWWELVDRWR